METVTMDVVAEENQEDCLGKIETVRGFCSKVFLVNICLVVLGTGSVKAR